MCVMPKTSPACSLVNHSIRVASRVSIGLHNRHHKPRCLMQTPRGFTDRTAPLRYQSRHDRDSRRSLGRSSQPRSYVVIYAGLRGLCPPNLRRILEVRARSYVFVPPNLGGLATFLIDRWSCSRLSSIRDSSATPAGIRPSPTVFMLTWSRRTCAAGSLPRI